MKSDWDFCGYVANLPSNRWVCRVLKWNPPGIRSQGRPCHTWESKVVGFCKDQCLGDWTLAARDKEAWANMQDDFIVHCGYWIVRAAHFCPQLSFAWNRPYADCRLIQCFVIALAMCAQANRQSSVLVWSCSILCISPLQIVSSCMVVNMMIDSEGGSCIKCARNHTFFWSFCFTSSPSFLLSFPVRLCPQGAAPFGAHKLDLDLLIFSSLPQMYSPS